MNNNYLIIFSLFFSFFYVINLSNCNAQDISEIVKQVQQAMDLSVDPCEDFYEYACGNWIKNATIPQGQSGVYKSSTTIMDHNNNILNEIISSSTSPEKIQNFNTACLNNELKNKMGLKPVEGLLTLARTKFSTSLIQFFKVMGELQNAGINGILFEFGTQIDAENPTNNIYSFFNGGLGLPFPGLYNTSNPSNSEIIVAYKQYMSKLFLLSNSENSLNSANEAAERVFNFESKIASFSPSADQLTDPFTTYNNYDWSALSNLAPHIDFQSFFQGINAKEEPNKSFKSMNYVLEDPNFLSQLSSLLSSSNIQSNLNILNDYLIVKTLSSSSPYLNQTFVENYNHFYLTILNGIKTAPAQQIVCINQIQSSLPQLVGEEFLKLSWSANAQNGSLNILANIKQAMKNNLEHIEWMDETTRTKALRKLDNIANMIGGPSQPDQYQDVTIKADTYFDNVMNARKYALRENLDLITVPASRTIWQMPASEINAYYDPPTNSIVFPAGIQQYPYFYYLSTDLSILPLNLGGIGVIQGHEITHGFDSSGSDYNYEGKLVDWWEPSTRKSFDSKVDCVINQYNQYEPLPGVFVNGNLTKGENVADMGGVKNAHHALLTIMGDAAFEKSIIPGFSNEQFFFVAYAQGWAAKQTPASLRNQINVDPHSPPKYRVIGPLTDSSAFSSAFNCPVGSKMNPKNKCSVW